MSEIDYFIHKSSNQNKITALRRNFCDSSVSDYQPVICEIDCFVNRKQENATEKTDSVQKVCRKKS